MKMPDKADYFLIVGNVYLAACCVMYNYLWVAMFLMIVNMGVGFMLMFQKKKDLSKVKLHKA